MANFRICGSWIVLLMLWAPLGPQASEPDEAPVEWTVSLEQIDSGLEAVATEIPAGTRLDFVDGEGKVVERLTMEGTQLDGAPQVVDSAPMPTWSLRGWPARPAEPEQGAQDPGLIFEVPLLSVRSGSNLVANDTTALRARMSVSDMFPPGGVFLFGGVDITEADTGTIQIATRGSDPDFESVVAFLTNGVDDLLIRCWSKYHNGSPRTIKWVPIAESWYFGEGPGNGIDLEGFDIESIALRFDHVAIESPGSDPNGDGNWTDFEMDATLVFRRATTPVEVPTLSGTGWAALVLALAAVGLWFLGRRSRIGG